MKLPRPFAPAARAFTLIELLVVMAIVVVLAGLTIGGFGVIKKKTRIARTQGELARVETAIENYKQTLGYYPPDNPLSSAAPSLYYELSGTLIRGANFQTAEGNETISTNLIQTYFGRAGFANATTDKNQIQSFLPAMKGSAYAEAFEGVDVELLVAPVEGPVLTNTITGLAPWRTGTDRVNPWNYVATRPIHRPGEFDLWADILIGKQVWRISNWAEPAPVNP
jgi:prepilin-type N-terminal cleavage/methylation domain-containing protein